MQKRKVLIIILICISFLNIFFIWNNSIKPPLESFEASDGIGGFLKSIIDPLGKIDNESFQFVVRKCAHITEFMCLGFLLTSIWALSKKQPFIFPFFTILGVATIDEFIQSFTGRTSAISDVLIDFLGACIGVFIIIIIYGIVKLKSK